MILYCPDLTGYEEIKAIAIGQGDFVRPVLNSCIKEKCAAYKNGRCKKYDTKVEITEEELSNRGKQWAIKIPKESEAKE